MKQTGFSNIAASVALFTASLLFIVCTVEIGLRTIGYYPFKSFLEDPLGRRGILQASDNAERIYEPIPNSRGVAWGTDVEINHFGYRGKPVSLQAEPGVIRIISIGDSITFGNNLPASDNFSAQLETLLTAGGHNAEVLNLGLGGYATPQEVATLEDIGLQFNPDTVVMAYCINDISVASGNLKYINRIQKYGESSIYHLRIAQFIRAQLDRIDLKIANRPEPIKESDHQKYKRQLADIDNDEKLLGLMSRLARLLENDSETHVFTRNYTARQDLARLRYALEELKALQLEHGFNVIVVLFPYLLESENNELIYQAVYKIIKHEMGRLDFELIDLYPDYAEAGMENLRIKQQDGIHPNRLGHRITAEKIYQSINR